MTKTLISRNIKNLKIIVYGLLPKGSKTSNAREKINCINEQLSKQFIHNKNVLYLKPDDDWTLPCGELNFNLYYRDSLHLIENGNLKLANHILCGIRQAPINAVKSDLIIKNPGKILHPEMCKKLKQESKVPKHKVCDYVHFPPDNIRLVDNLVTIRKRPTKRQKKKLNFITQLNKNSKEVASNLNQKILHKDEELKENVERPSDVSQYPNSKLFKYFMPFLILCFLLQVPVDIFNQGVIYKGGNLYDVYSFNDSNYVNRYNLIYRDNYTFYYRFDLLALQFVEVQANLTTQQLPASREQEYAGYYIGNIVMIGPNLVEFDHYKKNYTESFNL